MSTQSTKAGPWKLGDTFANLTDEGGATPVPVDANFWASGIEQLAPGRLVSLFRSDTSWTNWEMHPVGDELVFQISGTITLIFDLKDQHRQTKITGGEFTIVPRGIWHTADIIEPGETLFITPGEGTLHKSR